MFELSAGNLYPGQLYDTEYFVWDWPRELVLVIPPGSKEVIQAIDAGQVSFAAMPYEDAIVLVARVNTPSGPRYWHTVMCNLGSDPRARSPKAPRAFQFAVCQVQSGDVELRHLPVTTYQTFRLDAEFIDGLQELWTPLLEAPAVEDLELVAQSDRVQGQYGTAKAMWDACQLRQHA